MTNIEQFKKELDGLITSSNSLLSDLKNTEASADANNIFSRELDLTIETLDEAVQKLYLSREFLGSIL